MPNEHFRVEREGHSGLAMESNPVAPPFQGVDSEGNSPLRTSLDMTSYGPYVSSVEELALAALNPGAGCQPSSFPPGLLDGQAGTALRKTIPLQMRREQGAFFSGSELRSAALKPSQEAAARPGTFLDPAVGAGDLLIEVARQFPVQRDLAETIRHWGQLLHGRDLQPMFVRLAKARLVLLAVTRGAVARTNSVDSLDDVFPEITVGDGLKLLARGWLGEHIVMNPPFTHRQASEDIKWASGRTNEAAIFLAAAVAGGQPGTRLTAILPDVIRAGSRYDRLREIIGTNLHVTSAKPYGQFDDWTDIDVFILRGVIGQIETGATTAQWWCTTEGKRLGDIADVNVGSVVPHRDQESEPHRPYLLARNIPLGGEYDVSCAESRGFQSRSFRPPFVAIRRTSRPGDKSRGVGTIISGQESVLVENHLIVLKPKDGSVQTCRRIVGALASAHAREWLDHRIRCRHLTVRALKELPWIDA